MKTLVLGDIHGRAIWEDIYNRELPDKVVFLGDYVSSHEGISEEQQINNLKNILDFKDIYSKDVILLRGNHDMQACGYSWADCSPAFRSDWLQKHREEFLKKTQWTYTQDNIIFSHAGVSGVWFDNVCSAAHIETIEEINTLEPNELFGFTPNRFSDWNGDSITQPLTWIRPMSLLTCAVKGTHIIGHTTVNARIVHLSDYNDHTNPNIVNDDIWLCDALGMRQYLIIEEGKNEVRMYDE